MILVRLRLCGLAVWIFGFDLVLVEGWEDTSSKPDHQLEES